MQQKNDPNGVADLVNDSGYSSDYRNSSEDMLHALNDWRPSEAKKSCPQTACQAISVS
jgi:hypothetical protein